jgi:signal transduction histidine kinase
MQSKISRIFIVLFNILLWYFIFHYFTMKIIALAFAVLIGISGIAQFTFHIRLERRIFKPISQLKAGVDEIAKGNYDVKISADVSKEISSLIDSFNEMARKLHESEKLKKAYEENRKTLIANISHDLKTPITSIQGYIETMLEEKDLSQEAINKYHQIIYNNTSYINKLIDDLFLFSKLDLQKLDLNIENISIHAYMEDLMEEFKYELEDRGVNFEYKDALAQDYNLSIDRKRVHQVFRNIIGNAVKYGSEGNTKINVRMYKQDNYICVDIADNGPGISEDKLPHIFDRFYRVDYARTKDLMSTGLGLAIAKELTEALAGKIKAYSTEGIGSCFTIMLPIEK